MADKKDEEEEQFTARGAGKGRDSFPVTKDDTMDSAVRVADLHDIPKR